MDFDAETAAPAAADAGADAAAPEAVAVSVVGAASAFLEPVWTQGLQEVRNRTFRLPQAVLLPSPGILLLLCILWIHIDLRVCAAALWVHIYLAMLKVDIYVLLLL